MEIRRCGAGTRMGHIGHVQPWQRVRMQPHSGPQVQRCGMAAVECCGRRRCEYECGGEMIMDRGTTAAAVGAAFKMEIGGTGGWVRWGPVRLRFGVVACSRRQGQSARLDRDSASKPHCSCWWLRRRTACGLASGAQGVPVDLQPQSG